MMGPGNSLEDDLKTVDCRGLACPGPVIQAKRELETLRPGESFVVIVDSEASRDNVSRFAQSKGSKVEVEDTGGGSYRLTLTAAPVDSAETGDAPPVILIAGETVGTGDDKLGRILMEGFVNTLVEQEEVPDSIVLMNAGVRLAVGGSAVLAALKKLTDRGCEILVCGTCLEFFGLKEELEAGVISNMYDIQRTILAASSVIRP
jgi:selenium metabolism protein YedF